MHKTLLALLGSAAILSVPVQAEQTLDSTAAVVNQSIILTSELNKTQQLVQRNNPGVNAISARRAALEQLITESLILQAAKIQGVDLTDMQLDQALQRVAQNNHTTVSRILATMPGLNEADKREEFKKQVIINEYRNTRVRSRINASDVEVDALANNLKKAGSVEPRYHLGQIIIPVSTQPTAEQYNHAQATARKVIAEARSGKNFNALAATYSRGSSAGQAGDLGFLPETSVPLPFVPALLKAKAGDVIGPFRSPVGLHILKVYEITHEAVIPLRTYDASHILIKTSIVFSDGAAKAKLTQIRKQITDGVISFAQAAKKYSEDPGSAVDGGDLGYQTPEVFDPAFANMMVSLKPGQISEPFRSSFGWHIIKLNDIKVENDSMQAYRDRARAMILERKFREEAELWEQELRAAAYVHVNDPALLNAGIDLSQGANK